MFRKIVATIIALPIGIVLVLLAVANRGPVTLSFDPFVEQSVLPAMQISLPLYLVLFATLTLGVIIGGTATWWRGRRWRRDARRTRNEAEGLRAEIGRLQNNDVSAARAAAAASLPAPRREAA